MDRVEECLHPERTSCRGCEYSYDQTLYDGGCKLYIEKLHQEAGGRD